MWIALAVVVVVALLLGIIWLAGWFFGLALAVKLALSAIVVAIVLVALLVRYLVRLQAASRLERELLAQGQKQVDDARPDRRGDLVALKQQAADAIAALKRSRLGRGGKTALYALPWYIIVGPPGAGKTTAIKESGLDFPLDRPGGMSALRGTGGTRNCDWWFTNNAILLDTAGRYATGVSDEDEWLGFLDIVRRSRPRKPINGLIVALSVTDLAFADKEKIGAIARQIRARIDEVTTRLKMLVPVYVLFTKADMIAGFGEFWSTLRPSEREQAWGVTFPLRQGGEPKANFDREFVTLRTTLYGRMVRHLQAERRAGVRRVFWSFPSEVAALQDNLGTFIGALFQKNSFQETPILRGAYFTSGTQNALPSSRVITALAQASSFRLPGAFTGGVDPKSFFLTDVFRKAIFPDQDLAAETEGERRRRLLVRVAAAALALVTAATLVLPAALTWLRNRELIQSTSDLAATVRDANWADAPSLERNVPRLDAAQGRLRQLTEWKENGPPVQLRWGMYVGDELYASLRGVYATVLARTVILPTKRELEDRLRTIDAGPIRTGENFNRDFDALKLYLMLGDAKHVDPAWAAPRLVREWSRLPRAHVKGEESLFLGHVAYVLDLVRRGELPAWELDKALVTRTRSILAQVPQMDRLYESLVRDANTELPGVRRETIFHGSIAPFVQSRNGVKVDGAYTKLGWAKVRTLLGEERAKLAGEQWVLGDAADASATATVQKLRELYFERYQIAWRDFLLDLQVQDPGNAEIALDELNALSEPEWPYLRLVRALADNVALDVDDTDDRGLVDKAVDKAKELIDGGVPVKKRAVSPVERAFKPILKFGMPPEASGEAPALTGLAQYEALLAKLVGALTDLRDAESGTDPKKVADVFQDAVRGAAALLSEQDGFTRPLLSPLLMNPITLAYRNVVRDAGAAAGATWEASVWQKWHDKLEGKYPFAAAAADAPLGDFLDFFAAGDGVLWSFYDESLKPTLDRSGTSFVPSRRFKSAIGYTPEFLDVCLKRGQEFTTVLFPPKTDHAAVTFEVNLHSVSSSVGEVSFEVDGAAHTYRNEPEQWLTITWPGKPPHGARLRVRGTGGLNEEIARTGDFGLFRLLDAADVKAGRAGGRTDGAPTLVATWDLRAAVGGASVSMDIRPSRNENPLVPGYFKGYNCPRLITSR